MKLKWEWDIVHSRKDVDLKDVDLRHPSGRPKLVGWVVHHTKETPGPSYLPAYDKDYDKYYINLSWEAEDPVELVGYDTLRQAMRALRTAYIMYVVGGGLEESK